MNKNFPQNLTVLLEPTAECNLRCRHCYHAKTDYTVNKMTLSTLDLVLRSISAYYKDVKIIWHGGEPLLMGYDFFENAYSLFESYSSKYGICFQFGVQTNGTLLDDRLIDLFEKTDTHISLSYDGKFNDVLRQRTHEVEQTIGRLKNKGVDFSCISTISSANVRHMREMYEQFKSLGVPVKFNPIYPDGAAKSYREYLITKEEWTNNFVDLFNDWFFDMNCNIPFTSCMDALRKYVFGFSGCIGGACLYRYVAVNSYGDLYPCGRLISDGFKLINVGAIKDIREAFITKTYTEILNSNMKRVGKCKACKWFSRCHSGCNASASLSGNLEKAYLFDCYFNKKIFGLISDLVHSFDPKKVNHYALDILNSRHCNNGNI